jgi:anti-sigma-K factor RskA
MDYARADRADALAAQYVAGTLRGRARRRFEQLLPGHPELRSRVALWQARLLPMAAAVAPVEPPARVWHGIRQRLWPDPAAAPWWQRLALWRGATGAATVAALALGLLLVQPAPETAAPLIVVLQSTGTAANQAVPASLVASVSGDGRALTMQPIQPVALGAQQVLELWSVPPEGQGGPKSLGLIAADRATVVKWNRLPAGLLKGGTAALAVSLEPPGGSPTGAPTGPVLFAGTVQRL